MSVAGGLITTAELARRIATADDLVVLDVRSGPNGAGRAQFEAGHIPGARHTDYAADGWRAKIGGAPGMLPDAAHLSGLFGRLGLAPETPVVIVPAGQSANDCAAAARIFWTLQVCGYTPLALLDGGMPAWIAEGRALQAGPAPTFSGVAPIHLQPGLRASAAETLAAVTGRSATLIDGRAGSYFRGEEKAGEALVAGHIPGALSIDYVQAYDAAANRIRPQAELATLYAAVPDGAAVISYCNTGHTAALNWFALAHVLGRRNIRLYDGSMTDWTQDPARPVAR